MKRSDIKMKFRDQTIHRLRAYEDMLVGGTLIFPFLGLQVTVKRQVLIPGDHQPVTPERIEELAGEQHIGCITRPWAPEPEPTPPLPEEVK